MLAKEGKNVVVTDILMEEVGKVAHELKEYGTKTLALQADVSNAKDVELNTSASLEVTDPSFAPALRRVVSVSCVGSGLVVSLTTQRWHQFFAAGVLNHNCDGLQYLCLGVESRVLSRRVGFRDVAEARKYEPSAAGWT